MLSQLVTPLPCKGHNLRVNNLKRTSWDLGFEYPNEGRLHNPSLIRLFLRSTFTRNPDIDPNAFLYKAWVTTVFVTEADLY